MKKQNYFTTAKDGFTIVEVLMVILVGTVLVSATAVVVNNLHIVSRQSKDLTLANAFAENKIESLRSIGYIGLDEGEVDFSDELPESLREPRSASYTVTSPQAGLKQIQMDISYSNGSDSKDLTYRSYVGELGVGQY